MQRPEAPVPTVPGQREIPRPVRALKTFATLAAVFALLASCTYDIDVEHAAKNLDLELVYSPCTEKDAASDR